jgi:hypothetical protein
MRRTAAVLLLAAAVVTGCGNATPGSGSGSGTGSGAPPTTAPVTPPPTLPTSALPTPPPEPTGTLTLTGVVERGVEPGCLVLRAGGRSYTLLGRTGSSPATGVPLSVPVKVVGSVATGMASYCQQGTLIKVVRATRA